MLSVALIQARYHSRRFQGKVLADLCGQPMLKHVIDRVRLARLVDHVVVATCHPGGGAIAMWCEKWGVEWYVHPTESDVLGRLVLAAGLKNASWIVRVCGDNPLLHPGCIDALLKRARTDKARPQYVGYRLGPSTPAITEPTGYFAEVVSREALEQAHHEMVPDDPRREHVTAYLYEFPRRFRCAWLNVPRWYRGLPEEERHTAVDTPADLKRVAGILERCQTQSH